MRAYYFYTKNMSVGYGGKPLIQEIEIGLPKGEILCLIGPNGAGKSTVLKSIAGQLRLLGGTVYLGKKVLSELAGERLAQKMSVVFTEKLKTEMMTCRDVVATGRYPYTGWFGRLSKEDEQIVEEVMEQVHITDIRTQDFGRLSDGQRQRVMFARAICQEPEIVILDEPTSYLDIRYKLEFLSILQEMREKKGLTVIMSLHELEKRVSDKILCLKGEYMERYGTPEEVFQTGYVERLFGVTDGSFDEESGSLELERPKGKAELFVIAGGGSGRNIYHKLQRRGNAFATGILYDNDLDYPVARALATELCRVMHRDGYRTGPFKSQNMALNSFVTEEGLEMVRAQVMQAEAAGRVPLVCMNPILLKPTDHTGCQVIANGQVLGNMSAREYFSFKKTLIPDIKRAFRQLEESSDIIIIEGAGSPAEINLRENDIVNMGLAEMVDAPVLLVGDIDRGGVFAQLLGTLMLLTGEERKRVKGLIINKFRGDKSLLDSGIQMIEQKGGIPVIGVIPYMELSLEDEDSLTERFEKRNRGKIDIAVIRYPRISNFTDFNVFEQIPDVSVRYITSAAELQSPDLIFLPGSKNTMSDLAWMRENGLESAVKKVAGEIPICGVCGGYQMLGRQISDPEGVEAGGVIHGMALLPIVTRLQGQKVRRQVSGKIGKLEGVFSPLSGLEYFPCHKGLEDFNCLFCYCPLYSREKCAGNPCFLEKEERKIKECTNCTFPHRPENYDVMVRILRGK